MADWRDPGGVATWRASVDEWRASPDAERARQRVLGEVIDRLSEARAERAEAHRVRLAREAARLGVEVGAHRCLLADAEHRLARLARELDPESPMQILLTPFPVAREVVRNAFLEGLTNAVV